MVYGAIRAKYESCGGFTGGGMAEAIFCPRIQKLVDGKTVTFDAGKAQACIAVLSGVTCAQLAGPLAPMGAESCELIFVGTRKAGEPCLTGVECVGGACTASPEACPGKCLARGDVGATCASSLDCKRDLDCANKKCAARATEGQKCDQVSCASGLSCGPGDICKARKVTGACMDSRDCTGICLAGMCGEPRRLGEACQSGQCLATLYCDAGSCKKWPGLGGACGLIGQEFLGCLEGRCELAPMKTMGTCVALLSEGMACKPSAMGGPANGGCNDGLACVNGKCAVTNCF